MASTTLGFGTRFQTLVAACTPTRHVKLTAQSFQLRCRSNKATVCQPRVHARSYSSVGTASETPETTSSVVADGARLDWKPAGGQKTDTTSQNNDPTTDAFRRTMRQVPYPVAIVTSIDTTPDQPTEVSSLRGLTVSSFTSVCLKPEPMVSFNVHSKSSTLDAVLQSGLFAVHILNRTPEARQMATKFARNDGTSPFVTSDPTAQAFVWSRSWHGPAVRLQDPKCLPPRLQRQQRQQGKPTAVLTHLLCETRKNSCVAVGDHVIVCGRVLSVEDGMQQRSPDESMSDALGSGCLTYLNGSYNVEEKT